MALRTALMLPHGIVGWDSPHHCKFQRWPLSVCAAGYRSETVELWPDYRRDLCCRGSCFFTVNVTNGRLAQDDAIGIELVDTMGVVGSRAASAAQHVREPAHLCGTRACCAGCRQGQYPTALGAQLFFWGRLAYAPVYVIGVPRLRTAL